MTSGIELAPLITKIKVDIKSFKTEMDQVKSEAISKADEVSKKMSSTIKVGENMSKLGGAMTKALTVPIVGAGVAVTKMAMDYETSFAKVSTLLDSNIVDYDKYKNDILDASSESKVAVGEFSEAVYGSISAGVDQTKAIQFTTDAMKLAKGGFTDGAKAVDVMTTAINGYGMKAEDATKISDMLITTQNLGKTTVDELASSMGAVIPVANSVNFGIDELSASYAQLTKNGIATAESGTYLKSMLSELGKSGSITDKTLRELTGKGFADLKKEGKSTSEILKLLEDDAKKNGKTLKDMFGSVEAGSAALVLAKGNGVEYNEMLSAMQSSAGATQKAFEKMDATPAEQLKGALNELKNSGIKLGVKLVPIVTKIADKISDLIDWFNKLTPAQQENIVKIGGMAAAAGPLLKVTGGLVQGFGKLKPLLSGTNTMISKGLPLIGKLGSKLASSTGAIGKVGGALSKLAPAASKAVPALTSLASGATGVGTAAASATGAAGVGGLLTSLGGMAVAAAPWVAGAAAIGAAGYGIYKCLTTEVVPAVDLFEDEVVTSYDAVTGKITTSTVKISEETQKQVQSYMDMDDAVSQTMYEMKINNTAITEQIASDMTSKFSKMGDTIITKQQETTATALTTIKEFYTFSGGVVDENEQAILDKISQKSAEQTTTIEKCKADIKNIYKIAATENREITDAEQQQINDIQAKMRDQAIGTLSETEEEAGVIRSRMKEYQGRLSAEMAGEMITKANETRDKESKAAQDKCDNVIKQAGRLKAAGILTESEYNNMIESAQKARDEQISKAEEACDGIKNEIKNATPGIEDQVNMQTGKVKTAWDKLSDWAGGVWDWISDKAEEAYAKANGASMTLKRKGWAHYNGLSYVPFDGYNATLHKGERVLTAKENQDYIQGTGRAGKARNVTLHVPLEIDGREIAVATREYNAEELGFI